MKLHRYWIKFEVGFVDPCVELLQGCGVTAYDQDDTLKLIREHILKDTPMPPISEIIEDIDVSTLDENHVLPNMGVPIRRGIWFPAGHW